MKKKISAFLLSVCISLSACSNETKFVDKGQKRIVGENESKAETVQAENEVLFSDIPIIKTISENHTGHYEGEMNLNKNNEEIEYDVTLDINDNNDVKLEMTSDNAEFCIMYFNDSMETFVLNPSGEDCFMSTKRIKLNNFACIKDHMAQYAVYAANNNSMFRFNEDSTKIMFDCNSSTLYSAICDMFDQLNINYTEIYRLTKEDRSFMSIAEEMFGDAEYDLSEGLSKNAMNDFTAAYGVIAQRFLLTDTDKFFSFTLTADDQLDTRYELKVVDENNNDLYTMKGELKKTSERSDVIAKPKNIEDYAEKDDSSSQTDIREDNDDIAPDDTDPAPEDSKEWDDNSFFEKNTQNNDWTNDEFFKK